MASGRVIIGIILVVIGGIFILDKFYFLQFHAFHLWPVILIILGIALIARHANRGKYDQHSDKPTLQMHGSHSKVFGDSNFEASGIEIDGFRSSSVFGDTILNLAGARLKPGLNKIDLSGTFGDITVIVPNNIEASANASSTFGDVYVFGRASSGMSSRLQHQTEGYDTASSKLNIWAGITFGDIKIYRA